jgi:hypothetical protein
VAETAARRLLCCLFRRIGKAMGQVLIVLVGDMSRNIFFQFEYLIFYVLYPFVTYLLTLPRTIVSHPVCFHRIPKRIFSMLHVTERVLNIIKSQFLELHINGMGAPLP